MYMNYTLNALNALTKIINHPINEPFYACERGLSSGEINSLQDHRLIVPTGNSREVFVPIGNDLYKKVEAKEWRILDRELSWQFLNNDLNSLEKLLAHFRK